MKRATDVQKTWREHGWQKPNNWDFTGMNLWMFHVANALRERDEFHNKQHQQHQKGTK